MWARIGYGLSKNIYFGWSSGHSYYANWIIYTDTTGYGNPKANWTNGVNVYGTITSNGAHMHTMSHTHSIEKHSYKIDGRQLYIVVYIW